MLLVLAGVLIAVLLPSGARATAPSQILAFKDAPLSPELKDGVMQAAKDAGVDTTDLKEVSGLGSEASRSGVFIGTHTPNNDYVSFYQPHGFTNFMAVEETATAHGPFLATVSAQPGSDGQTSHVELAGVTEPTVERVTIELASGTKLSAELIKAGQAGYSFFTYASDDPKTFPNMVRAYGTDGQELASHDYTDAIKPPVMK
jgi:hypothetical protein